MMLEMRMMMQVLSMMKKLVNGSGVGLLVLVFASVAQAEILVADDFSGAGGALNGATTDVGGLVWQAGPTFHDDGTVDTIVATEPDGEAAYLPFVVESGKYYVAEATITNPHPDWVAFGFMPALPPQGDWTETHWSVRHSNNGTYAWVLTRDEPTLDDQEGYNGPNTDNAAFLGDLVDPQAPVTYRIELDTTAATWLVEYFLNDVSQGVFALDPAAPSTLAGIGFSRGWNPTAGTLGTISAFTVRDVADRTISGTILENGTTPFEGASVVASNGGGSDTTDASGQYAIVVPDGWSGDVTPTATGYTMFPSSLSYTDVTSDVAGEDYSVCDDANLGPCLPYIPTIGMWGRLVLVMLALGTGAASLAWNRRYAS
jgi:hypothetical protein